MTHPAHVLWTELYRPTTIDSFIFADNTTENTIRGFIQTGAFPHLLLSGPPGCGKTTLVGVLLSELGVSAQDILRINCSDERGIDTFRTKIKNSTALISIGPFRVLHLEESDALTLDAQEALRAFMEEQSNNVRFAFTCNAPNKLTDRLRSRCMHIPMGPPSIRQLVARAADVLLQQNVQYDDRTLLAIVRSSEGDMRQVLTRLQSQVTDGVLADGNIAAQPTANTIELLRGTDWKKTTNALATLASVSGWESAYRLLYDNIAAYHPVTSQDEAVVIIAEHLYRHASIANPTIGMAACVIQLLDLRTQ